MRAVGAIAVERLLLRIPAKVTGHSGNVTANSGQKPEIGHVRTESPVTLPRNGRSRSGGMSGHVGPEYATIGRCLLRFIERLWRSVKYEEVYLHAYASPAEARRGLDRYFRFYKQRPTDQELDRRAEDEIYVHSNGLRKAA